MKKGVYMSRFPNQAIVLVESKPKKVVFRFVGEEKDTRRFMDRDTFCYLFEFISGDVKFHDKAEELGAFEIKIRAYNS